MKVIKRKCQSCGKILERDNLIKITKLQDNTLKINPKSNELGRSAYVCKNQECIIKLIKKKRLKNALKTTNMEEIAHIEQELLKLI